MEELTATGQKWEPRTRHIKSAGALYPSGLRSWFSGAAPETVWAVGSAGILSNGSALALFCSSRCPGDQILRAYDLAQKLRDQGVTVGSGFHSPVEKECPRILLHGKQPVIVCPARSLANLRVPGDWKRPLESGRLLLLSSLSAKHRRVTADLAKRRNEFVTAIADWVCFIHVSSGGELEALRDLVRQRAKPIVDADGAGRRGKPRADKQVTQDFT